MIVGRSGQLVPVLLRPKPWTPRRLFARGEVGVWYDPSDLLRYTASGTLGSGLATNGGFGADTDWTKGANWTIGSGVATKTGGAANDLTQTAATTADRWYYVSADVTRTAGTLTVSIGTSGTTGTATASGAYQWQIKAGSSTQTLTFAGDSSFAGTVDNVTVRELTAAATATMFQDSAGTTPALRLEVPIGLILDQSRSLAQTSIAVTNNTFAADSDWTKGTNWAIGSGVATKTATNATALSQTIGTTAGQWYKITADITRSAGTLTLSLGTSGTTAAISAASSGPWYILAGSGTQTLAFTADASYAGTVDNVVVTHVAGNHAYQSTSASRPTLTSRVNLLTYTEDFSASAWSRNRLSTPTATADYLGTTKAWFLPEDAVSTGVGYTEQYMTQIAASYTWRLIAKAGPNHTSVTVYCIDSSGIIATAGYFQVNLATGAILTNPNNTGSVQSLGNGWYLLTATFTPLAGSNRIRILHDTDTGVATNGIYVSFPDVRLSSDAALSIPSYQRVGSGTGATSTAAGVPDYDTAGFPVRLRFDGSDDSMMTAAVDLSGTDAVTLWAGAEKRSDAAAGMIAELTATTASNNGSFSLRAPDAAAATFLLESKGTSLADAQATSQTAPKVAVLTGAADISADTATLRVNGTVAETATDDQGTGNYSNAILYVGRRGNASLPFNGSITGLIVRGAATVSSTIAAIEKWLGRKNGQTL